MVLDLLSVQGHRSHRRRDDIKRKVEFSDVLISDSVDICEGG